MRHLKLPTVTDIVRRTDLSYEDVLRYFYQEKLDARTAAQIQMIINQTGRGDDMFDSILPRVPQTIGVLLPEYIVDDYMAQLLSGIKTGLHSAGYTMTYHGIDMGANMNEADAYYTALFSSGLAEAGFIISYTAPCTEAIVPFCEKHKIPYILVDRDFNEETGDSPAVALDNRQATFDAMLHLFKLGHRRIGFITGLLPAPSAYFRLEGYKDALTHAGLPFDPELVVTGNWQVFLSKDGTEQLLKLDDRPTAIVASNDVMALSALSTATQAGLKIPNDLSVVGFDDIEMAAFTNPGLTTIRQPIAEMGKAAAEMAVTLAEGKKLEEPKKRFLTSLVIRKSTGPARRPRKIAS